ncbi:hypothetical protein DE146DRAFT_111126 [Phaeosphaeria sp. MPI-PUGE-AT-0046c]|nr:hypothetical protein DE146DRAFT_111126 [Phaeosphaeria sp. MPI-PUGE-AT-0046c]
MGLPVSTRIGSLTWKVAIAILTAQLCPRSTEGYVPILSELISWILVAIFCEYVPRLSRGSWKEDELLFNASLPFLSWAAAGSLATVALSFSVEDSAWIIPAVTSVLALLRRTTILPSLQQTHSEYLHSAWLPIGAALSIVILAPSLSSSKLAMAGLALLGQIGLYGSLIRMFEPNVDTMATNMQRPLLRVVRDIAFRAMGTILPLAIAVPLMLLPGFSIHTVQTIFVGIIKAMHWLALFSIIHEVPWDIATTIWTCAAASRGTAAAPISFSFLQSFARPVVTCLALYHTIAFTPTTTRYRYLLYIFAIWPIASLVKYPTLNGQAPFLYGEIWNHTPSGSETKASPRHPIEDLVIKSQVDLALLLERQSRTSKDAETEYRRRYSREPPPGFDKWFVYAQSKQSLFIDDFDMINADLAPFWKISPLRLLEGIDHVVKDEDLALRKCGFTDGQYHGQGGGWIVDDLGKLLEEVARDIPNVEFAFDVVDEPRVVITKEMLNEGGTSHPEFFNERHRSIWGRVTGPCLTSASTNKPSGVHDHGVPFIQDWHYAKDVCQHPEFEQMHGFFSSPATCMLTDAPIPVLSQAAPTSFGDIMYPSPWYTEKVDQGNYKDEEDPPWDEKTNTVYWAGSTTGSHSTGGSWKHSHRQRLVQLVQMLGETNHKYMKEVTPGLWESYEAIEDHRDLFDVKLTAIIQCDEADCEEQKEYFNLGGKEDRSQQFRSRFILDVDGNSFSGRYYTLLQSRSVVLKQTVLREWHDERLLPWVHFIPISLSMEELPEIMRYMTSHEEGRRRAKEIAVASREWHKVALRREDFTIYLYRLMLELARVMDPNRIIEKA